MTDLVTFGETMLRLSPPRGERLETVTEFDAQAGGAESNVAVTAANLGADAVWFSKLPASPLGRRIVRELRSHGVRTGVAWDDSETARLGTYFLEFGGAPRGAKVVYDRADASITTVDPEELPGGVVETADYFHVSGITPALSEATASATAHFLKTASAADTTTVMDLNYRRKLWPPEEARSAFEGLFGDVDVLVCAQRDAREVLDVEGGDAVEIAHSLRTDYGFDTVVVTRGERGALALHDDEVHEQPAFETDTHDAIGTGDAFVGGFLTRRIDGGSVAEALAWAAATAALKRTISGDAATITRGEVEAVLDDEAAEISR